MFIGMVAGQAISPILEPPLRPLAQQMNKLLPTQILPTAESLTLFRRKKVDEKFFKENLAEVGFNDKTADLLFQATEYFPNVNDGIRFAVREAFREDIATLFQLDENFEKLPLDFFEKMGIDKDTLRLFWRSHWELPSVGQGFEMFQRLSDLQLPYKRDDLKALGLTEDDVRTNQFELNTLLTTQDIMEPWRRRLTMIAYQPITRVDIRRFVENGTMTLDEAEFRFRELGNSPADAKLQVKFIRAGIVLDEVQPLLKSQDMTPDEAVDRLDKVIENKQRAQEIIDNYMLTIKKARVRKEKDLTRSQLEAAFEENLITENDFLAAMQEMGYDQDESEVIMILLKNKIEEKERKALEKEKKITKAEIVRGYISGNITRDDASNLLDGLRYNNDSIELILLNADSKMADERRREEEAAQRAAERQAKEQSKSDTTKAFKKGILSESEARDELKQAHFNDDAIDIIMENAKKEMQGKEEQ